MDPLKLDIFKQSILKDDFDPFETIIFNLYFKKEYIGYAKIKYISNQNIENIKDTFDFYIVKNFSHNHDIIKFNLEKNEENLIKLLNLKDKKSFSEYKQKIIEQTQKSHLNFINYWQNKPSIEIIRIFDDKDIKVSLNKTSSIESIQREAKNFKGNGYGLFLYDSIISWCSENGMELWSSKTRTEDAMKIWGILEKHPKFSIISINQFEHQSFETKPRLAVKIKSQT